MATPLAAGADGDTVDSVFGQPVHLRFTNVQPETGKIWISVCTEAELPKRDDGACTESIQIDALEGTEHTFDRLPPGTYAITAFHDENDNGWMDWDTRGLPFEATGNARNAKGNYGPPTFEQMKINIRPVQDDANTRLFTIRLSRIGG
ncbi:MAG: DUF2141 domain-containing protein [Planctomycetota bacterium]